MGRDQSISVEVEGQPASVVSQGSTAIEAGGDSNGRNVMTDLFRYPPPEVSYVTPTTLPTSGGKGIAIATPSSIQSVNAMNSSVDTDTVYLDIYGSNFGSRKTTTRLAVYLLSTDNTDNMNKGEEEVISVTRLEKSPESFLVVEHTHIRIIAPEGEGARLRVVVEVGGDVGALQNSTSTGKNVMISFNKPEIHNITLTQWPTSGCVDGTLEDVAAWSLRLDGIPPNKVAEDPLQYARRCTQWQTVTITGNNFGRSQSSLIVVAAPSSYRGSDVETKTLVENLVRLQLSKSSALESASALSSLFNNNTTDNIVVPLFPLYPPRKTYDNECLKSVKRTHHTLVLCTPVGYGPNLRLYVIVVGQSSSSLSSSSSVPAFSLVHFDKPVLRRSNPNPYSGSVGDAGRGGDVHLSTPLTLHGLNFGGTASPTIITLNGKLCNVSQWISVSQTDGLPYVTCNAPRDVVGPKNLTLYVAGQQMAPPPLIQNPYRSIVRSVCTEGPVVNKGLPVRFWGRVNELCSVCPIGGLCNVSTYNPPTALPGFYLTQLDIDTATDTEGSGPLAERSSSDQARALEVLPSSAASSTTDTSSAPRERRRCPAERYLDPVLDADLVRNFPLAVESRRDLCLEIVPCTPQESCLGENECAPAYAHLQKQCMETKLQQSQQQQSQEQQQQCNSTLQCKAFSTGTACLHALDQICHCPKEWEPHSFSCYKKCLTSTESRNLLLEKGQCEKKETLLYLERRLAGGECTKGKPQDCQSCIPFTDPFTLEVTGTCQCDGGGTRCSLCTSGEYFRIDNRCEICPAYPELLIAGFIIAIFFACVGCYFLDKYKFNMALVSIGVDYFQGTFESVVKICCVVLLLTTYSASFFSSLLLLLLLLVLLSLPYCSVGTTCKHRYKVATSHCLSLSFIFVF